MEQSRPSSALDITITDIEWVNVPEIITDALEMIITQLREDSDRFKRQDDTIALHKHELAQVRDNVEGLDKKMDKLMQIATDRVNKLTDRVDDLNERFSKNIEELRADQITLEQNLVECNKLLDERTAKLTEMIEALMADANEMKEKAAEFENAITQRVDQTDAQLSETTANLETVTEIQTNFMTEKLPLIDETLLSLQQQITDLDEKNDEMHRQDRANMAMMHEDHMMQWLMTREDVRQLDIDTSNRMGMMMEEFEASLRREREHTDWLNEEMMVHVQSTADNLRNEFDTKLAGEKEDILAQMHKMGEEITAKAEKDLMDMVDQFHKETSRLDAALGVVTSRTEKLMQHTDSLVSRTANIERANHFSVENLLERQATLEKLAMENREDVTKTAQIADYQYDDVRGTLAKFSTEIQKNADALGRQMEKDWKTREEKETQTKQKLDQLHQQLNAFKAAEKALTEKVNWSHEKERELEEVMDVVKTNVVDINKRVGGVDRKIGGLDRKVEVLDHKVLNTLNSPRKDDEGTVSSAEVTRLKEQLQMLNSELDSVNARCDNYDTLPDMIAEVKGKARWMAEETRDMKVHFHEFEKKMANMGQSVRGTENDVPLLSEARIFMIESRLTEEESQRLSTDTNHEEEIRRLKGTVLEMRRALKTMSYQQYQRDRAPRPPPPRHHRQGPAAGAGQAAARARHHSDNSESDEVEDHFTGSSHGATSSATPSPELRTPTPHRQQSGQNMPESHSEASNHQQGVRSKTPAQNQPKGQSRSEKLKAGQALLAQVGGALSGGRTGAELPSDRHEARRVAQSQPQPQPRRVQPQSQPQSQQQQRQEEQEEPLRHVDNRRSPRNSQGPPLQRQESDNRNGSGSQRDSRPSSRGSPKTLQFERPPSEPHEVLEQTSDGSLMPSPTRKHFSPTFPESDQEDSKQPTPRSGSGRDSAATGDKQEQSEPLHMAHLARPGDSSGGDDSAPRPELVKGNLSRSNSRKGLGSRGSSRQSRITLGDATPAPGHVPVPPPAGSGGDGWRSRSTTPARRTKTPSQRDNSDGVWQEEEREETMLDEGLDSWGNEEDDDPTLYYEPVKPAIVRQYDIARALSQAGFHRPESASPDADPTLMGWDGRASTALTSKHLRMPKRAEAVVSGGNPPKTAVSAGGFQRSKKLI